MNVSHTGMDIQVINLDTAVERWKSTQFELGRQGLVARRVSAVDGRSIGSNDLGKVYDPVQNREKYFDSLHPGEIGCFLSHYRCWQDLVKGKFPYGLILEDDIEVIGPLKILLSEIESKSIQFDILKLDRKPSSRAEAIVTLDSGIKLIRPELPPLDAAAYILSYTGARKLIEGLSTIYMPVDVHFQLWWVLDLNVLCAAEPVVRQKPLLSRQSTIKARKKKNDFLSKLRREIKRPLFRYRLARLARNKYSQFRSGCANPKTP